MAHADLTLVGQLRRLATQLQQAADQLDRLGALLHAAEVGTATAPLDEQQLINLLLASQRGTPPVSQAPRPARYAEVADELERLAALLRGAESGAAPGPVDEQQLLSLLRGAQRNPRATPDLQRYAQLLELLSSMGRR